MEVETTPWLSVAALSVALPRRKTRDERGAARRRQAMPPGDKKGLIIRKTRGSGAFDLGRKLINRAESGYRDGSGPRSFMSYTATH